MSIDREVTRSTEGCHQDKLTFVGQICQRQFDLPCVALPWAAGFGYDVPWHASPRCGHN